MKPIHSFVNLRDDFVSVEYEMWLMLVLHWCLCDVTKETLISLVSHLDFRIKKLSVNGI